MALKKITQIQTLPSLEVHSNRDLDALVQRVRGEFDFTAWTTVSFQCPDLLIVKTSASATELTVTDADNITVHLKDTDYNSITATSAYVYSIYVSNGVDDFSIGEGKLTIYRPVA